MPRLAHAVPKYRLHKASGQAVVTLAGEDHYLGPWKSKASKLAYDDLIVAWIKVGRPTGPEAPEPAAAKTVHDLVIVELCRDYVRFASDYYRKNGQPTAHLYHVKRAMKALRLGFGQKPAIEFGPLALQELQNQLVAKGHSRTYVNDLVAIVKRAFKWTVTREKLPSARYEALQCVSALKQGRTDAREPAKIGPVADEVVALTLPYLPAIVQDMVRLQRATAMRPGEVCAIRPCDVDTSVCPWTYVPASHKTQHHGRERSIFIGPRGQHILRPYMTRDEASFCFDPAEAETKRSAKRRANRRSPMTPSQAARKPKRNRKRPAGNCYDKDSYGRAVARALVLQARRDKRDIKPKGVRLMDWLVERGVQHWHPNQLRHTAATFIRKAHGLEALRVVLGHTSADTTAIYAERDAQAAAKVMESVG